MANTELTPLKTPTVSYLRQIIEFKLWNMFNCCENNLLYAVHLLLWWLLHCLQWVKCISGPAHTVPEDYCLCMHICFIEHTIHAWCSLTQQLWCRHIYALQLLLIHYQETGTHMSTWTTTIKEKKCTRLLHMTLDSNSQGYISLKWLWRSILLW